MSGRLVVLINPNLVAQRDDLFTTGIVYAPIGLASLGAALREAGYEPRAVDAFGERPGQFWTEGRFLVRGLTPAETAARVPADALAVLVYAINLTYHRALTRIIRAVKAARPSVPVVVVENTQAVTAYAVAKVQDELYDAGADYVLTGEAEERGPELLRALERGEGEEGAARVDGAGFRRGGEVRYTKPSRPPADLDRLPFPAWDLFPMRNYWRLRYAHGPLTSGRYLPILTSRGCPYPCAFCVIPETNGLRWRGRSAGSVADEMERFQRTMGVSEFHVEDVDPTVDDGRTRAICEEILRRGLKVRWKLCAGTKVETMRGEETVELMARAGCRYVSISPESGSERVLKAMRKPFDLGHALRLTRRMRRAGIRVQACFVLGFPGEEDSDREATRRAARELTAAGVDEIALFVATPVPGSAIFERLKGWTDYSQLHFSPTWRPDYPELQRFRLGLYRDFLWWKLKARPLAVARQGANFLLRRFETKMEMTPYRALHTALMLGGLAGSRVAAPEEGPSGD